MVLRPGERVGPYELIQSIGAGGMGQVWVASEPRLGRRVALKFLAPEFSRDSARMARFEREARSAWALSHPNVCHIYAVGEADDGTQFIAMEWVQGETLHYNGIVDAKHVDPVAQPVGRIGEIDEDIVAVRKRR